MHFYSSWAKATRNVKVHIHRTNCIFIITLKISLVIVIRISKTWFIPNCSETSIVRHHLAILIHLLDFFLLRGRVSCNSTTLPLISNPPMFSDYEPESPNKLHDSAPRVSVCLNLQIWGKYSLLDFTSDRNCLNTQPLPP